MLDLKMIPILLLSIFTSTQAYSSGAPEKVCYTMMPNHGGGILPQDSDPPFSITAQPNNLGMLVTIHTPEFPFEGFLLQGRTPRGDIVGTFDPIENFAKTMNCAGTSDNSLTHTSPNQKEDLKIQWHPKDYVGPLVFNATIAQRYDTFWLGVQSQQLQAARPKITSNTTPNYKVAEKPEASAEFDPFYEGCGTKKSCFGAPEACVQSKNCKAVVAITVYGGRYEFELKADKSASWVGVGLSEDAKMGDDSVVECVKDRNGGVKAYMSWTSPRPNLGVSRPREQKGIQMLSSSIEDGVIYCRVQRDAVTTVNNRLFDLINNKYILLVAAGKSVESNRVGFHDVAYIAGAEAKSLSDVSEIAAASKILLRLHGAFMLTAWIGTASVGMLLARYFRQTWVGSQMCGKDLWFAWHRFFMVLTWALTTVGFIVIFVELKAWSSESNPHAILGLITTILCFIQPIGAYFRPHPGTSKRPIFNWAHWFGGNAAHIIGIVAIFFAVELNKAELPTWMYWILVAYVVLHVATHFLLSILGCAAERSAERRVTSFPMKDLAGSGRTSTYSDSNADAPLSFVRKILLVVYLFILIVIVVILIFIIVVAPVEEYWEKVKSAMQTSDNT
ncbi:Reeler domain [Popillia japonica]|uniref:Reeler domain n=1 Tax=Popillia japonica TaxID=7064 RepID=A0AAW1LG17_POPJA